MMIRDALVVGINHYQDDRLDKLNAPANDAEAIAQTLTEYSNFQVTRLPEAIDRKTKKPYVSERLALKNKELERALVQLFKPEGKGKQIPDTALFYFSGHGIAKNSGIQEGFLATSDVDIELGFYGLSLAWLRQLLEESPIKQQIIWLDCCHSGILLNFDRYNPGDRGLVRDRCFIAASREFELAYEVIDSEYSVFTKILLEALNPVRNSPKWITNISVTDFIYQKLSHQNQRPICSNFGSPIDLTTTSEPNDGGEEKEDKGDICPYKGLEYFDCNEKDPQYFYGREELIDRLLDRVRKNNFLAILGASGSGKSSVLRAGLIHQLKLGQKLVGSQDWQIKIMIPTENPLQSLANAWLEPNLSDIDRASQLDRVESLLKQGGEGLRKLVQASTTKRVILVIDQFEEVFTLCEDLEKRETFLQCLLEALAKTDQKLCLVLAMRIDFLGKCFAKKYSGLGDKIQAQDNFVAIAPMETEELTEAIVKPAEKVNLSLESGLVQTILKDLENSPESLPLLQDTLTELWKRKQKGQLTLNAYTQLEGIGGSLNRRATDVYRQLSNEEQDTAKHIFLALITLGEGTEDTRRRVLQQDLITSKHNQQLIEKVIQKLADERLIVTRIRNLNKQEGEITKEAEIDVAHEALIRNWLLLRQWLDESRDILREKRKIENGANEWKNSGKKTDYLLTKTRLKLARQFQQEQETRYPLSLLASNFVRESIKYQNQERIKTWGLSFVLPLILSVTGYFVFRETQLNADKSLIRSCQGQEHCHGRIEALERLVKAKRSLKSYNLQGANLNLANLRGANLNASYLNNADLEDTNFSGSDLIGTHLSGANLKNAILQDTNFEGAAVNGVILYSSNLSRSNFNRSNLNGSNLHHSNLSFANLSNANLNGANLSRAILNGANLSNANLNNSKLNTVEGLTNHQIKSACNWEKAYFALYWDSDKKQWVMDEEKQKAKIEELKEDKASEPEEKPNCDRWG